MNITKYTERDGIWAWIGGLFVLTVCFAAAGVLIVLAHSLFS